MLARTLLACAAFVVAAVAQGHIAFTVLPTNITAGQPVTLQWGGGDGSPVTLILQQGTVKNLETVELITGSATGNSYTWTPETSLPNADNYALKIVQGDQPPNYTGMITLTGGSTSGPTNAVSALSSSTASGSSSASVPTNPASGGVVGGGASNSSNATTTMPMPMGTGAVGTGASGAAATGSAMSRNTTMSMATLSSSASMASKISASSASAASATAASSSTSSSGSGSSTSSSTAPSSSSKSGAVSVAASNFALLCAAVVGVAYLG